VDLPAKTYFRNELRDARYAAFRDAEGFQAIVFAVERLGSALAGRAGGLSDYQHALIELARRSSLAEELPRVHPAWHAPFSALYRLVREGRNDALHQGAYARRVADHAVQLSMILEDALMGSENLVRDFMVRDVSCAVPWQPISAARQVMLANSFSFLPIRTVWEASARWLLISDYAIARFLHASGSGSERSRRLAKSIQETIESKSLEVEEAETCTPDDNLDDLLKLKARRLLLVLDRTNKDHLVGAVTPFDLL
jgi:hypothetical protein